MYKSKPFHLNKSCISFLYIWIKFNNLDMGEKHYPNIYK